jgi:hypothetical protein
MTRPEFVKAMAYLTAGCGKSLEPVSLEVYFDLLGDLPFDAFQTAVKRVLLRHKYATFPTVAELREAAAQTARGEVAPLPPAEAWALAWRAAARTDPEIDGSFDRAATRLPPLVRRAIEAYGLNALCYGSEPLTVVRAQFLRVYEQLAAGEAARELLPAATRREIEACGKKALALACWSPLALE